jgi:hypothetical protein
MPADLVPEKAIPQLADQVSPAMRRVLQILRDRGFIQNGPDLEKSTIGVLKRLVNLTLVDTGYSGPGEREPFIWVTNANSVFQKQGEKATREWGRRFDHGYSQAIDWAHKLDDLRRTNSVVARFDLHEIYYEMVLIAGRDKHLDTGEKQRLNWRSDNVLIGNKKVLCMTFDGLLNQLRVRLRGLTEVARIAANLAAPVPPPIAPPE